MNPLISSKKCEKHNYDYLGEECPKCKAEKLRQRGQQAEHNKMAMPENVSREDNNDMD